MLILKREESESNGHDSEANLVKNAVLAPFCKHNDGDCSSGYTNDGHRNHLNASPCWSRSKNGLEVNGEKINDPVENNRIYESTYADNDRRSAVEQAVRHDWFDTEFRCFVERKYDESKEAENQRHDNVVGTPVVL